jgi:hypothetical protein
MPMYKIYLCYKKKLQKQKKETILCKPAIVILNQNIIVSSRLPDHFDFFTTLVVFRELYNLTPLISQLISDYVKNRLSILYLYKLSICRL